MENQAASSAQVPVASPIHGGRAYYVPKYPKGNGAPSPSNGQPPARQNPWNRQNGGNFRSNPPATAWSPKQPAAALERSTSSPTDSSAELKGQVSSSQDNSEQQQQLNVQVNSEFANRRQFSAPSQGNAVYVPRNQVDAMAQYQAQAMSMYQMQMANRPPPYFALDVECIATGPRHDQRSVAQIALVDQWERVLLNFYVKPSEKIFSYLPQLTGLTEEIVSKGADLQAAIALVKSRIPPNAILVGQNVLKDINWLHLQEGVDFGGIMDLSGVWRVFNEQYKSYTYFSLQHQAKALLGVIQENPHNAATDAILSMRLYNLFKYIENNPEEMDRAHKVLLSTTAEASFAKQNPTYDGVCMGNKKTCSCGAPFFF